MAERRRDKGDGSLFHDRTAGRWVGQIDLGISPDGRRLRPKVYCETRADARAQLQELRDAHERGVDLTRRSTTFEQLVDLWLQRGLQVEVSDNTRWNYERVLRGQVLETLGSKRVVDLRADDVEAMLDALTDKGLAASTMRHALNLTRRVLTFGMQRDLVLRNVAEPVQPRRGPKAERYGLTVKQARTLLAAASTDRLGGLITVSLLLGLRPGEAAGLTWEHVHLKGKRPRVTIAASLRRTPLGVMVLAPPKTPTSRRTLELPPAAVDALKAQKKRQRLERDAAGRSWSNKDDLVFTTEAGTPLDPSNVRRTFQRIARQAGLEHLHPHMLRHAAASLLSAAGVPLEEISDTLGHRSVTVTAEIYRHPIAPIRSGHIAAMSQLGSQPSRAAPRRTPDTRNDERRRTADPR
ncbi:tyrosine-type recombinase/integrase [Cellulomonas sp. NPDC055163]